MSFSIKTVAGEYVQKRFPHASTSEKEKIINDWTNKISDSQALVVDFKRRVGDPRDKKILDVGSGNGGVSIAFALAGGEVCGIDVEKNLYEISVKFAESRGVSIKFFLYEGFRLPFEDDFFDYAVSVSVLEHTTDPIKYLSEILRVTKPKGKLYLAFPNKFWPKETHTGLWFLSYLPNFMQNKLTSIFHRSPLKDHNLHFYSYFGLERMIDRIKANGSYWRIVPERGGTQNFVKKAFKKILNFLDLPYKTFLSHISVILEKVD